MEAKVEINDSDETFITYREDNDWELPGHLDEARYMVLDQSLVIYWLPNNIILGYN